MVFHDHTIYLSTNTATSPRGDYVQVSGVLQTHYFCICLFLMILFLPILTINETILILKVSLLMLLALHSIEFIYLNSFDLLEHLHLLLTSTLAITVNS